MEIIKKYLNKDNKTVLLTTLIIGFINFFYLLTHHVLSNDGLVYGPIYKSKWWEITLGRPLLVIVDRLRGGLVNPPIIISISLIIIAISSIVLIKTFNIKNELSKLLITILLVLFPTISESALFIYCFDGYMLALLFSILGIYFIKENKPIYAIISIILSLSLYQSYISITITGVFILYIIELLNNKNDYKTFIKNLFIVFIGLLSYFILLKLGLLILGKELTTYKGASSFGINTLLSLPQSIINTYLDYYIFFFKESIIFNNYYLRNIINILLYIILLIIIISKTIKLDKKNIPFLIIVLLLYPIATNIMNLIAVETRINLVTGIGFVMFYILLIILIEKYTSKNIIKNISITLLLVLSSTYLLSNNGTFMSKEETHNNYYYTLSEYLYKASALEGYNEELPYLFNDIIRYEASTLKSSNGYLAKNNETFDNYLGIQTSSYFAQRFLGKHIYVVEKDVYDETINKEEFIEMQVGEVKIIDNIICIKNSEENLQ